MRLEFDDADGDRVSLEIHGRRIVIAPSPYASLDREKAALLASVLSHFAKTGELIEPTGELNSIGEVRGAALKKLEQDVATLREDRDTIVECLRALGAAQGQLLELHKPI